MPLPPLYENGHAIVATAYYPPQVTGSSVLMHNLLKGFDPSSFTVATARTPHAHAIETDGAVDVRYVMSSVRLSYRLNEMWRELQIPLAARRILRLAQGRRARLIVGVYPDYHMLSAALSAAKRMDVPFVPYLHDTVAEALDGTRLAAKAARLQEQVFAAADRVFVMSEGMADLYRRKYALEAFPIVHTYPEPVPAEPAEPSTQVNGFWSGSLYRINLLSFRRVNQAFERANTPMTIATNRSSEELKRLDVRGDHVGLTFYSRRPEYLAALRRQGILIQALDWPDESTTHEDELATIFPTKTPEYLAAGVPMLVHCPEHYFLARFVKEAGCGLVVGERNPEALDRALLRLTQDAALRRELGRDALRAARRFSAARVVADWQDAVSAGASVDKAVSV